ncbi:MAG: GNAT family N-acetyltransferase [Dehalococcoidia bacterium]
MTTSPDGALVQLLADHEPLFAAVGEMRWQEWGHPPEPEDPAWWVDVTAREAGRGRLPVTWVAVDEHGAALGAVGLAEFDIEERRDRSPWVVGMIVQADRRGQGVGGLLMAHLEAWAGSQGYEQAWVATGGRAVAFYQKCGWELSEVVDRPAGETATVLTKRL